MRKLPLVALSLTALVGCKAIDAMDNTDTMRTDLAQMKQTMGGMSNTTGGMAGTTDQMDCNTSELKRLASVGAGIELIGKPENTREFTPPQASMLAGAKLIAENMTNDELIKFMYAKLKELNKTVPSEDAFDRSQLGGYSSTYVKEFNRSKQVQAVILQAVAAQIPQQEPKEGKCQASKYEGKFPVTTSIPALMREQIEGAGGRFSDTMYTTLMLRAMFINSFYLDAGVFSVPMDTMGKLEDAFTYVGNLQFVASLPYADKIKFELEGTAFLPAVNPPQLQNGDEGYSEKCVRENPDPACKASLGDAPNINAALDPAMAKTWWKKIVRKIDRELPDSLKGSDSPYARRVAEIREIANRNAEQN